MLQSNVELFEDQDQKQEQLHRGKKVLVIEDDVELITILDRVLKTIDPKINTDWVTSAEQAAAILEENIRTHNFQPYDLILADIFLEGSSTGLDVWKMCQQYFPDVPVVVTSALPVDKFFAAIGRDTISPPFLAKPFLAKECKQVLEGILTYSSRPQSRH